MEQNPCTLDLVQLTRRSLIVISGVIAFFLTTTFLDVSRRALLIPSWTSPIGNAIVADGLFWLLFLNNVVWIIGSLLGLRALANNSSVQQQLKDRFLFQQPLLLQIVTFMEHGMSGVLYILLTGDERKGYFLAWMLVFHVALALIFAPRMANVTSDPA